MIQEINIQLDKQAIRKHIEQELDKAIQNQLWFVDVDKIAQLTSMSKRFLEDEVLCDPRMKAIERRKARKRFYSASQALQVITEITNEW